MAKITGIRVVVTTLGQSKEGVEGVIVRLHNIVTNRLLTDQSGLGMGDNWDNETTRSLPNDNGWYPIAGDATDLDSSKSSQLEIVIAKLPGAGNHFHKWSMRLERVVCQTEDGATHELVGNQPEYDFQREYSELHAACNQI
jgi:hypothetical protein